MVASRISLTLVRIAYLMFVHRPINNFTQHKTALPNVHDDMTCNTDNDNVTAIIRLDMSAACDTIDHTLLIERMSFKFVILQKVKQRNAFLTLYVFLWYSSWLCSWICFIHFVHYSVLLLAISTWITTYSIHPAIYLTIVTIQRRMYSIKHLIIISGQA